MLSVVSLLAIALILGGLALGWTRRFIAAGSLVLINVAVHILTGLGPAYQDACTGLPVRRPTIHNELGLCTERLYAGEPLGFLQMFTSMFVHGDILHLFGNMFILLAFALVFEDLIGPRRLIAVYLVTGILAAGAQMAVDAGRFTLMVGASGAVAGITGAFAGAFPHMALRLPIPLPIIIFVRMRVITWGIMFLLIQLGLQAISSLYNAAAGVAYAAHIGGFAFGLVMGYVWIRPAVRAEAGAPVTDIDFETLRPYAVDSEGRRALAEMEANHDEPEVFQIWAERFWERARDPETGSKVRLRKDGSVVPRDD